MLYVKCYHMFYSLEFVLITPPIQVDKTVTRPRPCQVDEVGIFILVVSMLW